jgi:alpha-1,6-mannosyltransferase
VLVLAGLSLQAVYAGFWLARYPLLRHYATPLLDLGKLSGYDLTTGAAVASVLAVSFVAHALGVWAARSLTTRALWPLIATSCVFQITLAGIYPVVAADVFNYILQGRLLAVHRLNPLITMPKEASADPWLDYSAYPDIALAYGPVWAWLSAGIAGLTVDNLLGALLGFKALAIAANLLNTWLIVMIVRRIDIAWTAAAVVAYAWSPLVLFETVANAHNDGLIAAPVLAAVWLVMRGGRLAVLAPTMLMSAVLMKYAPIVLLPSLLIGLWRTWQASLQLWQRLLASAASVALAGLAAVLAYLPHWVGLETFAGVRRQANELTTSLAAVVASSGIIAAPPEQWLSGARLAIGCALLAFTVWRRPRTAQATGQAFYDVMLAQLLVGTFWFQPWYITPLVALAAATASRWRLVLALVFAASASASYLVYFYLWTTSWWGTLSRGQVQALAAAVTFLPLLLTLVLVWRRRPSATADGAEANRADPSVP